MRYFVADSFADKPFAGNPAAVVLAERALNDEECLAYAAEFNLSETCFVSNLHNDFVGEDEFNLRWFTPTNEVALCGHGTLATAATLLYNGNTASSFTFHTLSGALKVDRRNGQLFMQFPAYNSRQLTKEEQIKLSDTIEFFGLCDKIDEIQISLDTAKMYLVLRDDVDDKFLAGLVLNSAALKSTHDASLIRGVSITKKSSEDGVDFVSRYFAPWNGIPEDPVNGSSHTNLTPYWSARLGKRMLTAKMLSKRTGVLHLEALGDFTGIGGNAVIVNAGNILV